jgi:hypothetical protein
LDRSFDFDKREFDIEHKFGVNSFDVKEAQDQKVVCFTFEAGVRWASREKQPVDDEEEQTVIARIECIIVGCYLMKSEVSEDALREFAVKNCGIHVWPYWREFLTNHCDRLRLPRVMLPITQFQALKEEKSGE